MGSGGGGEICDTELGTLDGDERVRECEYDPVSVTSGIDSYSFWPLPLPLKKPSSAVFCDNGTNICSEAGSDEHVHVKNEETPSIRISLNY